MKKIFCLILVVSFCLSISYAQKQSHPKVRVTFKNGIVSKGSKALIMDQSISFSKNGLQETYPLTDIKLVEAKKGSTVYWALGCGGGCLAVCAITIASNDPASSGYENSQLAAGAAVWTVFSVGAGILIGQLTDKYKPVYTSSSSSIFNRFDLGLSSMRLTKFSPNKPNLTLSYKF
jgi:hypothetical protein